MYVISVAYPKGAPQWDLEIFPAQFSTHAMKPYGLHCACAQKLVSQRTERRVSVCQKVSQGINVYISARLSATPTNDCKRNKYFRGRGKSWPHWEIQRDLQYQFNVTTSLSICGLANIGQYFGRNEHNLQKWKKLKQEAQLLQTPRDVLCQLHISLSHSRSLKVIRNYTLELGVYKSLLVFNWNYRVAQIKIPHRTKCNFSTTMWDFYTQIF